MKIEIQNINKAFGKAYLKQSVNREDYDPFKTNLERMLKRIKPSEIEEYNHVLIHI